MHMLTATQCSYSVILIKSELLPVGCCLFSMNENQKEKHFMEPFEGLGPPLQELHVK